MKYDFDHTTADGQKRLMRRSVGQPEIDESVPIRIVPGADYGFDPVGNGRFRLVPSGDIVDLAERKRRLGR